MASLFFYYALSDYLIYWIISLRRLPSQKAIDYFKSGFSKRGFFLTDLSTENLLILLVSRRLLFFLLMIACLSLAFSILAYSAMMRAWQYSWMACPILAPISIQSLGVNLMSFIKSLWQKEPLEASIVYEKGMSSFLSRMALAVVSLKLEIRKMQLQQRNIQVWWLSSFGRIFDSQQCRSVMGNSGPYINTFFFIECPWKSRNSRRLLLNSLFSLITRSFKAIISGKMNLSGLRNSRLKSLPLRPVLQLPATTPSGLSMGTTLKTTLRLRYWAAGDDPQRNSRNPCIMKEPLDSPGWALPEITMHFLGALDGNSMVCWWHDWQWSILSKWISCRLSDLPWSPTLRLRSSSWMVSRGTSSPPSEVQSLLTFRQEPLRAASCSIHLVRWQYSQGTQQANCTSSDSCSKVQSKDRRQNFWLRCGYMLLAGALVSESLALVAEVVADLLPAGFVEFVPALGEHEGLHAPGVEALGFLKVTDVEPILGALPSVADLEVVPLQVALGVAVDLDEQVVLEWPHQHCAVQVPRLEQRVEVQVVAAVGVIPQKCTIREFYLFRRPNVRVREVVGLPVVHEVAVLVTRAQIHNFMLASPVLQQLSHDCVDAAVLVDQWDWVGQQDPRHPPAGDVGMQRVGLILDLGCRWDFVFDFFPVAVRRRKRGFVLDEDLFLFQLLVAGEAIYNLFLLHQQWELAVLQSNLISESKLSTMNQAKMLDLSKQFVLLAI